MLNGLDHVVILVRDLDAAAAAYERLLGRATSWRGEHPGLGTANALFRLNGSYVELLSPNGEGGFANELRARLDERGEGGIALAFATDSGADTAAELRRRGIAAADPLPGSGRESTSGAVRRWHNVVLPREATRGLLLFAIEHDSPPDALPPAAPLAPADEIASGLDHVVVASEDPEASRALYGEGLGLRLALDRVDRERGVRLLFFRVGGVTVEVVGRADAPPSKNEDRFWGIAYRVGDADAARARVAAAGCDVSEVRPGRKPGTRVCTVRDGTCGVPTLLIGPGI
jgi:catechol 2,3-dioxygenase-like lactoylglutathione lyase family enzyme